MENNALRRSSVIITDPLLRWYDVHQRILPWRTVGQETPDPYRIWLSEIMLQQTQVVTVIPYFNRFIELWHKIESLAAADVNDVLREWAGLGYYARARNLHRCAQIITLDHAGDFPEEEAELLKLPGIGPYTAAAVAAIAFGKEATPVDGNVERVIARVYRIKTPIKKNKLIIKSLASRNTPKARTGDYAQAVMDLGATVCTPRRPLCFVCPLTELCGAFLHEETHTIPINKKQKKVPRREGTAYVIINDANEILLYRRTEKGLLGGMLEVPSIGWEQPERHNELIRKVNMSGPHSRAIPGTVEHVFTHFKLVLRVIIMRVENNDCLAGLHWYPFDKIASAGLPKLMLKVVQHFLANAENSHKLKSIKGDPSTACTSQNLQDLHMP